MKKTWFKKTVFSYLPSLYVTIAVIVFLAIFIINEVSLKEAERTNRYSTESVIHTVENHLKSIEQRVINQMQLGEGWDEFFRYEGSESSKLRMLNYEALKRVRYLILDDAAIQSIYLYRLRDNMILAESRFESAQTFGDRDFLFHEWSQRAFADRTWSDVRLYNDNMNDNEDHPGYRVISFSQKARLPMGGEGLVVINVSVDALISQIKDIIDPHVSYLHILDGTGQLVFSSTADNIEERMVMNRLHSSVNNWEFVSGLQTGVAFSWMQFISRIWIVLGIATIVFSLAYTLFITKRNYRPIEQLVQLIQSRSDTRAVAGKGVANDEFAFIQKAIDRLIDENALHEAQVQETQLNRRKQAFATLLESDEPLHLEEWNRTLLRLDLPQTFEDGIAFVIEIDHYQAFERKYPSRSDQNLMKFSIANVLQEFVSTCGGKTWSEWNRKNRMTVVYLQAPAETRPPIAATLDSFRSWVGSHLGFTVTIGVGTPANQWEALRTSYRHAIFALQYKLSLGYDRVLFFRDAPKQRGPKTHGYYGEMNRIAQELRLAKQDWSRTVERLFDDMREGDFSDDEILHLFEYFKSGLNQAMEELPHELSSFWKGSLLPEWHRAIERESMDEIAAAIVEICQQAQHSVAELVKTKSSAQTIHQIREYVEANYWSSELCLTHLSDKFNINSKYVSQLFKEHTGVNFADYLLTLRMERAKQLLASTDRPINDIASLVGYDLPLSFGRTFKKSVGMTPSDYRKHMQSAVKLHPVGSDAESEGNHECLREAHRQ
ncbi:helix-turn-helix protein [Paenibacillus cellulosilyticus]|uniref:Helix-turn-helix protein n=1 Tax=Paenibacillus cellulosilyticus TaxID=375489 RepID=A0A2V2YMU0_9BACL|nr:helix-turn-helix domain-containing protein [Paenibacillus cellulosilyticus]PWV94543.1 helix-turn-helix protein [Paenibacillus cellulosilyticus]QKS45047.1 helix-turn-helix domain-containing protein [Paenibacillus cellulosilyticus]